MNVYQDQEQVLRVTGNGDELKLHSQVYCSELDFRIGLELLVKQSLFQCPGIKNGCRTLLEL